MSVWQKTIRTGNQEEDVRMVEAARAHANAQGFVLHVQPLPNGGFHVEATEGASRRKGGFRIPVVGAFFAILIVGALLWFLVVGESVPFYNDTPGAVTVDVAGKKLTVGPSSWAELHLRGGNTYTATAVLGDGSTQSWPIDMRRGPTYANVRAYAVAGTGCFALVDVSKVYGVGKNPVRILAAFHDTHLLEKHVEDATILDPGPLPDKAQFNRKFDLLVQMQTVPCTAVANEAAVRALEAAMNQPAKR